MAHGLMISKTKSHLQRYRVEGPLYKPQRNGFRDSTCVPAVDATDSTSVDYVHGLRRNLRVRSRAPLFHKR